MKLAAARRKFPNEWIAFLFDKDSETSGEVLFHHKNRKKFGEWVIADKTNAPVYLHFTGRVIPKGMVLVL